MYRASLAGALLLAGSATTPAVAAEAFVPWQAKDYAIEMPLGGLAGDPRRGREIVRSKDRGNCLACHSLPIPEESFHGTVGPPLAAVASRLTEGPIRLRVADEQQIVPGTVMPPFYRNPAQLNRVAEEYFGKTVLTAQEVEDVVAYLMTLR